NLRAGKMGSHAFTGSFAERPLSTLGQRRGLRPLLWIHGGGCGRLPHAALQRSLPVGDMDGQEGLSPDERPCRPGDRKLPPTCLDLSGPALLFVLGAKRDALATSGGEEVYRHV